MGASDVRYLVVASGADRESVLQSAEQVSRVLQTQLDQGDQSWENLRVSSPVNLELAVLPTQRLGGHLVQGHVDGVGTVVTREPGERWERFVIAIPRQLMKYVVPQGSITVNGVSLTVGSLDDALSEVELWIIPETSTKTTFGILQIGDKANIEVDVLGKYVERLLAKGVNP